MTLASSVALAGSRVVIVKSAPETPLLREAVARLQAELGAAGFVVTIVDAPPGAEPRAALDAAVQGSDAFAAVSVVGVPGRSQAELWVLDRVTQKTVIRTVDLRGASAPAELAVRASELLQASLLEADPELHKGEPATVPRISLPPDVKRWMTPPGRRPRPMFDGFSLEGALGLMHSFDGIGPAGCPLLRLSYGQSVYGPALLAGRLGVAGPCAAPDLEAALGVAAVRQEAALFDLVFAFAGPDEIFVPFAAAGGGLYHLRATGSATPPYKGQSADVWAGVLAAGLGGGFRISERASLVVDAHTLFTQPRAVVTFAGENEGAAGRPSLLVSLGLLAAL